MEMRGILKVGMIIAYLFGAGYWISYMITNYGF
ncbi:hypothetical protein PQE70_gp004 [Bacillus phage vB_BanS_Nate]|uniref:Uncharacterized protein n=1 Tax=Bacillus phage vB_BanS_Nate TaxID=2894788 RepID=A0AAE8YUJ7_9CAUD|nr:hypothetical protein PQE70_gp004 [Bacillus phage vB_BanS_Nate]UGO50857.1 hypothetical protein NATE_4 [Bacillus phage vB_BanS_Nate]